MPYRASKIYYDGSHYIAVPKENFPSRKGGKTARKSNPQTDSIKAKFETAYAESQTLPKRERRKYVTEKLQDEFTDDKQAEEYVKRQTERKRNNAYKRYTRLWHKVYLQRNWNFFVTCTYSDEKHTEQTFQKTLRNTLKHLVSRKGWKYNWRVGAFRKRAITFSRNILYSRKRYGGRTETSQRLQHQTTPHADDIPKYALFEIFRQKRFQRDKQKRCRAARPLSAQIH